MPIGVKAILLAAAIVLFLIAWLSDENFDLVGLGLAAFAAAFLIENLGLERRVR